MKKLFFLSVLALATTSCSDKLTNSKAEKIAEECLKKTPEKKSVLLYLGEMNISNISEDTLKYKKLAEQGFVKLEILPKHYGISLWNIELTEKAKPFIEKLDERDITEKYYTVTMKAYSTTLSEVKEVVEMSEFAHADVLLEFKKTERTPFEILDKTYSESEIEKKNVSFSKTSEGWRWCQN